MGSFSEREKDALNHIISDLEIREEEREPGGNGRGY